MSPISRSQSQVNGLKPALPTGPLLSITCSEFEEIWREVKWDTRRVNKTLDLFRTFCREDLNMVLSDFGNNNPCRENGLMSNHRLLALLKSIAIIGTESNNSNDLEFFTRNDLCVIMTGVPFIDKKNFLRLMCLLDRSTPHTTTSPAGIARLRLVFSYYDWGWKGYLDEFDWKRLRTDIINSTYYGRLGDRYVDKESKSTNQSKNNNPVPESLREGIEELGRMITIRSMKGVRNTSKEIKNECIKLSINNCSQSRNFDHDIATPDTLQSENLRIDFPLFIKLVEYRVVKGTSQILRVELPGRDQEESIIQSIRFNNGSIFLGKLKSQAIDAEGGGGNYNKCEGRNLYDYDNTNQNHTEKSHGHLQKTVIQPFSTEIPQMRSTYLRSNHDTKEFDNIEKSKQMINDQIQELDNELNSLKMAVRQSNHSSNSSRIDISELKNDPSSKNALESVFGPPPEDLHGIFCDKPNDPEDLGFASIVVPTSSTPIRKPRSNKLNDFSSTPNENKLLSEPIYRHSQSYSSEKISNRLPTTVGNIEIGGPPILI
ncbi:hypothetical protein HWI79_825 [Cryptosporidium felis]|nr:hypothetical protein HWI79_825 [Cryptosporidium felis]